jgi:hypothetical protein
VSGLRPKSITRTPLSSPPLQGFQHSDTCKLPHTHARSIAITVGIQQLVQSYRIRQRDGVSVRPVFKTKFHTLRSVSQLCKDFSSTIVSRQHLTVSFHNSSDLGTGGRLVFGLCSKPNFAHSDQFPISAWISALTQYHYSTSHIVFTTYKI